VSIRKVNSGRHNRITEMKGLFLSLEVFRHVEGDSIQTRKMVNFQSSSLAFIR
jgi:hypothetical protein